jgi:hypothetical protein
MVKTSVATTSTSSPSHLPLRRNLIYQFQSSTQQPEGFRPLAANNTGLQAEINNAYADQLARDMRRDVEQPFATWRLCE